MVVLACISKAPGWVPVSQEKEKKRNSGHLTAERYFKFGLFVWPFPWLFEVGLLIQPWLACNLLYSCLCIPSTVIDRLVTTYKFLMLYFIRFHSVNIFLGFMQCIEYLEKWLASSFDSQISLTIIWCGFTLSIPHCSQCTQRMFCAHQRSPWWCYRWTLRRGCLTWV